MNEAQKKAIQDAQAVLHAAFPDFHGSIRFNMKPDRVNANVNIEQSYQYAK